MEHTITLNINININDELDKLKIDDKSLELVDGLIKNIFSEVKKTPKKPKVKK